MRRRWPRRNLGLATRLGVTPSGIRGRDLAQWTIPHTLRRSLVRFKVGSKVVYPSHGVAEIVGREKRKVDGKNVTYLVLAVPERGWGTSGDMKVSVPEDKAEDLGVRSAVSEEDA